MSGYSATVHKSFATSAYVVVVLFIWWTIYACIVKYFLFEGKIVSVPWTHNDYIATHIS